MKTIEAQSKLKLIASLCIFGTISLFVRNIALGSGMIALSRGVLGSIFLLLYLALRRQKLDLPAVRNNLWILLLSGGVMGLNWALLFEAYRYTTVATATLCYYMQPVFLTLAAAVLLGEKLSLKKGLCVLVALCGMVLISGTAGSGKSTTQACIIDRINRSRDVHIITLEDPIEFLHRDQKSIVSQREIAIDTADYPAALRACLRQAPDVILLGEMRDYETIRTAMTAAETGHLVIATLHTRGAVTTVDRIVDSFPAEQQAQARVQLSMVLHAVASEQLLPDEEGGLVPAFELMFVNPAIRNLIRDHKSYQIDSVIQTSGAEGMIAMDQSIAGLYRAGKISARTAETYAVNPDQLRRQLGL